MLKPKKNEYFRVILIIGALLFLVLGGYWFEHHVLMIESWIESLGHWASLGYITLFILLTPLFVSVDLFCIIAGALFSLPLALFDVLLATMIAAAFIFWVATHLKGELIHGILKRHRLLRDAERLLAQGGLKILFLIRLLPLPFAPTSYLFAMSRVKFFEYWISTSGIFLYNSALTYFGFLAGHLSKQITQGTAYSGPSNSVLLLGVVFCLGVILLIARIAKSELERIKNSGQGGAGQYLKSGEDN